MSTRALILTGLAALLALVIVKAPAQLLLAAVPAGAQIQLSDLQGSLWRGSASQLAVSVNGKPLVADRLEWRLQPASLLRLSPTVDLQLRSRHQHAELTLSWLGAERWRVSNADIQLPASALVLSMPGQLNGLLDLQLRHAELDGRQISALQGRFSWQRASWHDGQRWHPLGDLAADLSAIDGAVLASVFDLGGPLAVDARLKVALPAAVDFDGLIQPRDQASELLREGLSLFAEADPSGRYRLTFSGQL